MTDNATLRCRDEGDGESEDLHYGRGRQQIIMKDKNFCGNCKEGDGGCFIPGHYRHAGEYYSWVCVHWTNTHPGGTERSESRAFDSHVVERNKTGGGGRLWNYRKRAGVIKILWGVKKEKPRVGLF